MEMRDLESGTIGDDNARSVEMSARLFPRLTPVYAAIGLLLLASTPFYGWWIALPTAIDAAKAAIAHKLASNGNHATRVYLIDHNSSVLLIGVAIFFAGGASSPFFPFLVVYAGLFPVLFGKRHIRQFSAYLVVVTVLTALGPSKPAEYETFFRTGTLLCVMFALYVFGSELMSSDLRYRSASLVDGLTGLPNRRSFEADLDALNERLAEGPITAALVIGDIDHFKQINDEHGHAVGDRVLKDVGHELAAAFRSDDLAYRIGGEEFAFIALGVSADLAETMADALRDRISVSYPAGQEISMSFGVAMYAPDESTRRWFGRSDEALFAAKRAGRNRVEMARPDH